jgi:hypothetical protein
LTSYAVNKCDADEAGYCEGNPNAEDKMDGCIWREPHVAESFAGEIHHLEDIKIFVFSRVVVLQC